MIHQVSGDRRLLETAKDFFRFVTTFFEPINASAVHIYHSALELSPLLSTIRQLYYHRRHIPYPRVVAGTKHLWYQGSSVCSSKGLSYRPFTWSPCGLLVAVGYPGGVEIRDPRSSELLATLRPTKPTSRFDDDPAYSPDGRSLAVASETSLTIWDIQTGGVAKEVELGSRSGTPVWSSDGRAIGVVTSEDNYVESTLRVLDVELGTTRSSCTFRTDRPPYLWAHNESFRIMTIGITDWDDGTCTADIFEVGFILTKIESFFLKPGGQNVSFGSFSPTTYRLCSVNRNELRVFNIRNSECLLEAEHERSNCFSPDGGLFAASQPGGIRIWKYASGRYTSWKNFPGDRPTILRLSPTSPSIVGSSNDELRVWRFDDLDKPAVNDSSGTTITVVSCDGNYMATAHYYGRTITITNLLSQTGPSWFIDTDMSIEALALTGNVLLVLCSETATITAWRLTEEGAVDGPLGGGGGGRGDSIWTASLPNDSIFRIEDQTVVIHRAGEPTLAYHTGTGQLRIDPTQGHRVNTLTYSLRDITRGLHHLRYGGDSDAYTGTKNGWTSPRTILQEWWVKDPEGRHRLWIPAEWRLTPCGAQWLDIATLRIIANSEGGTVIVKF